MKPILTHPCGLAFLAGLALIAPSQAAILANFDNGAGTTSADQFAGIAGNGWTSAWGNSGSNIPTTTVTNTTQINGAGNYLTVNANGTSDGSIGRAFDGVGTSGGVDATQPVTFSFDLRIDSLTGWDSANDYLSVHSSTGNYNVSNASSFIIRAYGASPVAGKNASEWLLYSGAGDGGGFSTANFQNSGMTIVAGTTYHFTITNYHATETYDVSIFDGTNTVSAAGLGWRADAGGGVQDALAFNNKESATTDTFGYSIDNISISGVPEPSSAALLGLAGLVMLRRRRAH